MLELRARQGRNFIATLMLSQGIPMLLAGDEIGRTQRGNNNAYCQDNELSWLDWEHEDGALLAFTQRLIAFRRAHRVFRRRHFFHGESLGADAPDIAWFRPDGSEMTREDWSAGFGKSIGVFLNGEAIPGPDERGERIVDDSFLVIFNAQHEPLTFPAPSRRGASAGCASSTPRTPSTRASASMPAMRRRSRLAAWQSCAGRADMELRAERTDTDAVAVVAVHGDLDLHGAPQLREALLEAIDANHGKRVVLDLEGVDFLDSAGLGVLVGGLKRARSHGGDLVLVATGRNVLHVLELTGLTRAFEIHSSLRPAVDNAT